MISYSLGNFGCYDCCHCTCGNFPPLAQVSLRRLDRIYRAPTVHDSVGMAGYSKIPGTSTRTFPKPYRGRQLFAVRNEDLIREPQPLPNVSADSRGSPFSHRDCYSDLPTNIVENDFVLVMFEYTCIYYISGVAIAEGHMRCLNWRTALAPSAAIPTWQAPRYYCRSF